MTPGLTLSARPNRISIDRQALVAACREVVSIPSLTGEETNVALVFSRYFKELGFDHVEIDQNGNVIGKMIGTGRGPSLMINGHIDHVPTGDMATPYSADVVDAVRWGEVGEAIYGRGTCDMKCNVMAAAFGVAAAKQCGLSLAGDVILVADVEEETDSPAGVKSVLERGLKADYGVSVESTNGGVYVGHRGKLEFELVVKGRTSHASEPSNGINAILQTVPFLQALEAHARGLANDRLLGLATVTITGFHSYPDNGTAVVPDQCRLRIDRRYVRGETPESCEAELRSLFAETAKQNSDLRWELALTNHYPLMFTDPSNPVVQAAVEAVSEVVGEKPAIGAWRFGVNGTFMVEAGIPTVGVGPGDERWAHTPEEHILIDDLHRSAESIAHLVLKVCGSAS
ncbi:M20 family metallopeptidase [Methylocapsa sp. S129]|uniref:M20 family metallopeptidase n=1 Tax=Methylocapsa sp. S129 TaxID=1641869 RepID=UPI00131AD0ED|nr:M20/M25/M40 family metallo-hydrolase [Methylocapsa sp. S129]